MMLKVKVLVIDDEIEFATTLAERLNIRGFETTACFKMPRLDGLETLEEIKNYNPDIEVIMLTGHGGGIPLIGAQKEKHGPFDCIMKPADINELTTKINQAMAKRQTSISRGESE
jgi:DNA-binding NtrC family response regulator